MFELVHWHLYSCPFCWILRIVCSAQVEFSRCLKCFQNDHPEFQDRNEKLELTERLGSRTVGCKLGMSKVNIRVWGVPEK